MHSTYNDLHAVAVPESMREYHNDYKYLVRNNSTAHTAFRTLPGLYRWLDERGLTLAADMEPSDSHQIISILGAYGEISHMSEEDFNELEPIRVTKTLSNGDYVVAKITHAYGTRTVHTLNPNVKTRIVFNHSEARQELAEESRQIKETVR